MGVRRCACARRCLGRCNPLGSRDKVAVFTLVYFMVQMCIGLLASAYRIGTYNSDAVPYLGVEVGLILMGITGAWVFILKAKLRHHFFIFLLIVAELFSFLGTGGDSIFHSRQAVLLLPYLLWSIQALGAHLRKRLLLVASVLLLLPPVYMPIASALNPITCDYTAARATKFAAYAGMCVAAVALMAFSYTHFREEVKTQQQVRDRMEASAFVAENILASALPGNVARMLLAGHDRTALAKQFPSATIAFIHLCDYNKYVSSLKPDALVKKLNMIFSAFDSLLESMSTIFKIETIGSTYLVASGLPEECEYHAEDMVQFLLLLEELCNDIGGEKIALQIGVNSGPVSAGIIGNVRCFYRVFGSTVNVASRMMSHGVKGRIQVSSATRELLAELEGEERVALQSRGVIHVKGKGAMETFWVQRGRFFESYQLESARSGSVAEGMQHLDVNQVRRTMEHQDGASNVLLTLSNFAFARESNPARIHKLRKNILKSERFGVARGAAAPGGPGPQTRISIENTPQTKAGSSPSVPPRSINRSPGQPRRSILKKPGKAPKSDIARAYMLQVAHREPSISRLELNAGEAQAWVGGGSPAGLAGRQRQLHTAQSWIGNKAFSQSGTASGQQRWAALHEASGSADAATKKPPKAEFVRSSLPLQPTLEEGGLPGAYVSLEGEESKSGVPTPTKDQEYWTGGLKGGGPGPQGPTPSPSNSSTQKSGPVTSNTAEVRRPQGEGPHQGAPTLETHGQTRHSLPRQHTSAALQRSSVAKLSSMPNRLQNFPTATGPRPSREDRRKSWMQNIQRSHRHFDPRHTSPQRRKMNSKPQLRVSISSAGGLTASASCWRRFARVVCRCCQKKQIRTAPMTPLYGLHGFPYVPRTPTGGPRTGTGTGTSQEDGMSTMEGARSVFDYFDEDGEARPSPTKGEDKPGVADGFDASAPERSRQWVEAQLRSASRKGLKLRDVVTAEREFHGTYGDTSAAAARPGTYLFRRASRPSTAMHSAAKKANRRRTPWCSSWSCTACMRLLARLSWSCITWFTPPFSQGLLEASYQKVQLWEDIPRGLRPLGLLTMWSFFLILFALLGTADLTGRTWSVAAMAITALLSFALMSLINSPIVTSQTGIVGRIRLHALLFHVVILQWGTVVAAFTVAGVPGASALTVMEGLPHPEDMTPRIIDCGCFFAFLLLTQCIVALLPLFPPAQALLQALLVVVSPAVLMAFGDTQCAEPLQYWYPGSLFHNATASVAGTKQSLLQSLSGAGAASLATHNVLMETVSAELPHGIYAAVSFAVLSVLLAWRRERRHRRQFLVARAIMEARNDANTMLENLFPKQIVESLKQGLVIRPRIHRHVGILWCDLCNFTPLADSMTATQLMMLLNKLFSAFDDICDSRGLWKMDTVGDAYVVLGGLFQSVEELYFASLLKQQREGPATSDDVDAAAASSMPSMSPTARPSATASRMTPGGNHMTPSSSPKRFFPPASPPRMAQLPSTVDAASRTISDRDYTDMIETMVSPTKQEGLLMTGSSLGDSIKSGTDGSGFGGGSSSQGGAQTKDQVMHKLRTHKLRQVLDDMFSIGNEMQAVLDTINVDQGSDVGMRIGVHCGSVVTGIVGNLRPRFHVFGVSVLRAEEMESTGRRGAVHCSPEARDAYFSSAFSFDAHMAKTPSKTTSRRFSRADGQFLQGYFVEPLAGKVRGQRFVIDESSDTAALV